VAYAVANFRHYDDAPADHGAATPSTSILTPQGATP
jgi:hypothetical protein